VEGGRGRGMFINPQGTSSGIALTPHARARRES
jgi:hypothetical protein